MSLKQTLWAIDPIGSLLFVGAAALLLLALDWLGGTYPASNAHVAAPLAVGFGLLLLFCLYGTCDKLVIYAFETFNMLMKYAQNGRDEVMVSLPMSSSKDRLTLLCPCLHLVSKGMPTNSVVLVL